MVPENDPTPGAVIAIQMFRDLLGYNPHCHILVTDGCFYGNNGMFRVAPPLELKKLEAIFRHKVFKMLLSKEKITEAMIAMLSKWRHSGFHVCCGNRISPHDESAMENLARYIIRASFSQERMHYLDQEGQGRLYSQGQKDEQGHHRTGMACRDVLAHPHPNRGEQMVRYYGHYSNVSRGKRQKDGSEEAIPCILEPEGDAKVFRRNWARLIQKIYEVDPLICPKCKGTLRIVSSIEDPSVIRDILKHLGIWLVRSKPPPKIYTQPTLLESEAADHRPQPHQDTYCYADPDYSYDAYIHS